MSRLSGGSEWALLVAPEPPYPLAGGGAIRTASVLEFLAARFRVHLVTFAAEGQPDPIKSVPRGLVSRGDVVRLPAHRRDLAARAVRNMARMIRGVLPLADRFSGATSKKRIEKAIEGRSYRIAVIEHFWCAEMAIGLKMRPDLLVLDMHNIESTLHERSARTEAWPDRWAQGHFARLAVKAERDWLPKFDLVLTASEADRQRLLEIAPGVRAAVYPNAIPWHAPVPDREEHCIAFSGNLEYHPNRTAVAYFAREIWPALRRRHPQLRWLLIGNNERAVREALAGDTNIELTGPVEDAVTQLARAQVVVVPVLAGSGTRVKILEAWMAGRAVVSTNVGAEGLPAVDGVNSLLADTPQKMASAVSILLEDADLRRRLGQAGRRLVEEQFCWPAAWRQLEETLETFGPSVAIRNQSEHWSGALSR